MDLYEECRERIAYYMKRPDWEYKYYCGETKYMVHLVHEADRQNVEDEMEF